jgi:hypothetical protein
VLQVQHLAPVDHGQLQSWSLDITEKAGNWISVDEAPDTIIPDNIQPGD